MSSWLVPSKKIPRDSYCPICESRYKGFLPLPQYYFDNARKYGYQYFGMGEMIAVDTYSCAICGASDRERLYAYWLTSKINKQSSHLHMIHFAPEEALSRWIQSNIKLEVYETADLLRGGVTHNVDIMRMPFQDCQYDCFICSHVLEHVDDDIAAIKELYRILRPGGFGILVAPIISVLNNTLEDESVISEDDRWKHFGQNDHVRLYAHNDFIARLASGGFSVKELDEQHFGSMVFSMLGLKPSSILYIVEKT